MKTITLQEAHNILEKASALILDGDALMYPSLVSLENNDENEFLYLSWTDEDGCHYSTMFTEGDNKSVSISGSSMFLTDNEGNETQITILSPENIEQNTNN